MNRIEVLKSSRGNSMIYVSGYVYTQHRVTEEKRIFRCEDGTCRSKYKSLNLMIQIFYATGWLKSFESDTFLPVEESKFIRYFNISSSI